MAEKQVLVFFYCCLVLFLLVFITFCFFKFIHVPKQYLRKQRSRMFRILDDTKNQLQVCDNKYTYTVNVINLDKDKDRMDLFGKNWSPLVNVKRFPAVKFQNGFKKPYIGCSQSHCVCALEFFEKNPNEKMVIIMEDDGTPFHGLNRCILNEYLDILNKNTDKFDMVNMSPYVWEKKFNPKNKCVMTDFAPNHYALVYNGNKLMNTHFMVYSKSSIPILKEMLFYLKEDTQIPIIIDRIWQSSHGPFQLPFFKFLVPNVCFSFQEDFYSNQTGRMEKNAIPSVLETIHENVSKLWNSRLSCSADENYLSFLKRNAEQQVRIKPEVTVILLIKDIKNKKEKKKLETVLEFCTAPVILLVSKNFDELEKIVKEKRFSNWPIKIQKLKEIDNVYSQNFSNLNFFRTKFFYFLNLTKNKNFFNKDLIMFPSFSKIEMTLFDKKKDYLIINKDKDIIGNWKDSSRLLENSDNKININLRELYDFFP